TWISQRFLVGLRRDAYAHVLNLPAVTSDKRRLGDVLTRLTSDVAAVESFMVRSEEHTSELQSRENLVCRLLLEKKKKKRTQEKQVEKMINYGGRKESM